MENEVSTRDGVVSGKQKRRKVTENQTTSDETVLTQIEIKRNERVARNTKKMNDILGGLGIFVQNVQKKEKKRKKKENRTVQPPAQLRKSERIAQQTKNVYTDHTDHYDDAFDTEVKAEDASVSFEDGHDSSSDDGTDGETKKELAFELLKKHGVLDNTGRFKEDGLKRFIADQELCATAIETWDWENLIADVRDAGKNNDVTKAETEEDQWVKWMQFTEGVKSAYSQELSETDLAALDDAIAKVAKEHLKTTLDEDVKTNDERFEKACGALVEKIKEKIKEEISTANSKKSGGEDDVKTSLMLSAVKVLEEILGVVIPIPTKGDNTAACEKHNDERMEVVKCVCEIQHEKPPEEERAIFLEEYRTAFKSKEQIQPPLNLKPVVVHVTENLDIEREEYDGSSDTFVLGEGAVKTIEDALKAGKFVILNLDVALATYGVGDGKSVEGVNWSLLRGRDCAKNKPVIRRIICETSRYAQYWKQFRPLFSTIARHKTKIVREVLKNFIAEETEQFLFCSVHIDATSYIAPGGKVGETLIQKFAKEDIARNTKKIIEMLLTAQAGFTIHVHSKWLFRDHLSKAPFRVDSIPPVAASNSEIEGDDNEVLRDFLNTGSEMCERGELSITDDSDGKRKISVLCSAHMSRCAHNGSHRLIAQKIYRSLLSGTSEKNDALKEFAIAGAACTSNFTLERLTKIFAEKVDYFIRTNSRNPGAFNAKLLG